MGIALGIDLPASRHGPRPSSRTMSRLAFSWFLAFKVDIDFRFDFGANLLQPQNLLKLYRFYSVFLLLSLFKIRSIFEYLFDPTWLCFWFPKSLKKRKISIPRGIIKLINFWTDLSSIFAAFWKPTWTHVGHLSRPKTAQEASKTISRRLQDDPKSAP